MSIVALKKKTKATVSVQSTNHSGFSLNGTHRSQGYIGQTNISRYISHTPMVGNTPKGHGGHNGKYNKNAIISPNGIRSVENSFIVKSSSLSYQGMVATKYKWINRPAPFTSVKSGNTMDADKNDASTYIKNKANRILEKINANCGTTLLTYLKPTNLTICSPFLSKFMKYYMSGKSAKSANARRLLCGIITKPAYLLGARSQGEYISNRSICRKNNFPSTIRTFLYFLFNGTLQNNNPNTDTFISTITNIAPIGANYSYITFAPTYPDIPVVPSSLLSINSSDTSVAFSFPTNDTVGVPIVNTGTTISFYFKTTISDNSGNILTGSDYRIFWINETEPLTDPTKSRIFAITINYGRIYIGNAQTYTYMPSNTKINDGQLHKIEIIIQSNNIKIIIDNAVDSYCVPHSFPNMIGNYTGTGGFFGGGLTGSIGQFTMRDSAGSEVYFLQSATDTNTLAVSTFPYATAISAYTASPDTFSTTSSLMWRDVSPNKRNLYMTDITGTYPTLTNITTTDTITGATATFNALYFGGTATRIGGMTRTATTTTTGYTVFHVSKMDTSITTGSVLSAPTGTWYAGYINGTTKTANYGTGIIASGTAPNDGEWFISTTFPQNYRANGVSMLDYNIAPASTDLPANIGINNQTASPATPPIIKGYVGEVIIFNRTLPLTEIAQIELYLKTKYNVSATTPYVSAYSAYEARNYVSASTTWSDSSPNARTASTSTITLGDARQIYPATQLISSGEISTTAISLTDYSSISNLLQSTTDFSNYTVFYVSRS